MVFLGVLCFVALSTVSSAVDPMENLKHDMILSELSRNQHEAAIPSALAARESQSMAEFRSADNGTRQGPLGSVLLNAVGLGPGSPALASLSSGLGALTGNPSSNYVNEVENAIQDALAKGNFTQGGFVSVVPSAGADLDDEFEGDGPDDAYGPPKDTYGPPKDTYGPPQPTYAPPSPTYAPPQPTYAPPSPTYAPPQPTSVPPSPTYAPPQPTYAPPSPTYAPPQPTYAPPTPAPVYTPPPPPPAAYLPPPPKVVFKPVLIPIFLSRYPTPRPAYTPPPAAYTPPPPPPPTPSYSG